MARPRKQPVPETVPNTLTVLVEDAISDGFGGFLKVGDTFAPVDDEAKAQLIARRLAHD